MSIEYKKIILILSILIVVTMVCINSLDRKVILNKSEEKIDKKFFAIMVEKEDGSGYVEVNEFPEGLTLNEELTGCIDIDGNKIENAISYNDGVVEVNSDNTMYCYLYFDAKSRITSGSDLILSPTTGLNTTLEGGLYRYQGTSVDNYICFGTSDKDTCLGNTDAHMYRIIGITEDGRIKVIKKEALNSTMYWYDNDENILWPNSILYSNLNGNSFLENVNYIPDGWNDKIETETWKYGDNSKYYIVSAEEVYNAENLWTDSLDAKIGLLYLHDYYYAYQSNGIICYSNASLCLTSWIHLRNNDTAAPNAHELIMARYGMRYNSGVETYSIWSIRSGGSIGTMALNGIASIRPVFFLKSDIELIGGTGKSDDPFIINY